VQRLGAFSRRYLLSRQPVVGSCSQSDKPAASGLDENAPSGRGAERKWARHAACPVVMNPVFPDYQLTVRLKDVVCGVCVPSVAVTVTAEVPAGVGVCKFTVAVPGLVAAVDVAVMVMGEFGLGSVGGAVYNPVWLIEPFPLPETAHVTLWLLELETVAENCWVVKVAGAPDKSGYKVLTVAGVTVTTLGGGELLPPQATRKPARTSIRHSPAIW